MTSNKLILEELNFDPDLKEKLEITSEPFKLKYESSAKIKSKEHSLEHTGKKLLSPSRIGKGLTKIDKE